MMRACFQCESSDTIDLYGHAICTSCKAGLRLFTDEKITEHLNSRPDYDEESTIRLELLEIDYIKKRIKLMHIQDRINHLKHGSSD